MTCLNEYFRSDEDKNPTRATADYSYLSEFCHPNSFAFTNHIDMEKAGAEGREVKVVFLKPDKQACVQAMPNIFFACMPLLFSIRASQARRQRLQESGGRLRRDCGSRSMNAE